MKSKKLNQNHRETIAEKLADLKFNELEKSAKNLLKIEAEKKLLLEKKFPKVPKHLNEYIRKSSQILFRYENKENWERSLQVNLDKAYISKPDEWHIEIRINNNDKILKINKELEDIINSKYCFKTKTEQMLKSFNTTKQLLESLPELKNIIIDIFGKDPEKKYNIINSQDINFIKKQLKGVKL